MFQKMDYIYMIYKEQSFTKAAEKLYVSQPCLSAAVKKIENEIGAPLFTRHHAAVLPTKIGLEYIAAAEEIMNASQRFTAKVHAMREMEFGSIHVGGSNYVSSYILPALVSHFSKRYPKIDITLTETSSVELEKKLSSDELDLIIDSFDEEQFLPESVPLLHEKILLAVPAASPCNESLQSYKILPENIFNADFPLSSVPSVPIDVFREENFILLKSGNNMYKQAMRVFRSASFSPRVVFRLDQLSTSYRLTAAGNGVSFVTDTIFKYHRFDDPVCLYNLPENPERTLFAIGRKNCAASPAIVRFIEAAQQFLAKE